MNGSASNDSANVEVRPYFATPVAVLALPDAAALNEALAGVIRERMAAVSSTEHSNRGGWQSEWDFAEWGGPAGAALLSAARQLADRLTCDRAGNRVPIDWVVNAWVDDGGASDDPALGGEFELQDPRGVAPAMYAPSLAINIPGGLSVGASELIRPKAGNMLMFPAWLSHCVRPYEGNAQRISIAFNFSLPGLG